MRRESIENVLYRAAENARNLADEDARNGRFPWARGRSTFLILTRSRDQLISALCEDEVLRARVRRGMVQEGQRGIDPLVLGIEPDAFEEYVAAAASPRQAVAAGLIHEDEGVAQQAARYVRDEREIPSRGPVPRSPVGTSSSSTTDGPASPSKPATNSVKVKPNRVIVLDSELNARVQELEADRDRAVKRVGELEEELARTRKESDEVRKVSAQLTKELKNIFGHVPSKRGLQKTKGMLRQAERFVAQRDELRARVEEARKRLRDFEQERQRLLLESEAFRQERDEAEAELHEELREERRIRRTLEERLGKGAWRAEYLAREIRTEIGDLDRGWAQLRPGLEKTRREDRLEELRNLLEQLNKVYPAAVRYAEEHVSHAELIGPEVRVEVKGLRDLRVTPVGGGREIGGSAILIEAGEVRLLVDAGLRPHAETISEMPPPGIAEVLRDRLDAVIVTHAHTDHSGYIPALVANYSALHVVTSPGTAALLPTMWEDSRMVVGRRAEAESRYLGTGPLYGEGEVAEAEDRIVKVPFCRRKIVKGVELELFEAGHVVGAAGVILGFDGRKVVVTGDVSDDLQATVGRVQIPGSAEAPDLLVVESTYCGDADLTREREKQAADLVGAVREIIDQRGRVLIPAFGLGRAQEVALILKDQLPGVPVLVDGLAGRISRIFEGFAREQGRTLEIFGDNVRQIQTPEQRRRWVKSFREGVVITTSGMMNGGPVIVWAQEILPDERSALFLCGYQDADAPGKQLLRLAKEPSDRPRYLPLPAEDELVNIEVRARVEIYHLSAHADREGLLQIIRTIQPGRTMLVHGVPQKQRQFRGRLDQAGLMTVPTGRWVAR